MDNWPSKELIEAATIFWDEMRPVFRFENLKMTPLLEKIRGFAKLPWDSPNFLVPKKRTLMVF